MAPVLMWAQAAFGSTYFLAVLECFYLFILSSAPSPLLPPQLVLDFLLVKCCDQSQHHRVPCGLGSLVWLLHSVHFSSEMHSVCGAVRHTGQGSRRATLFPEVHLPIMLLPAPVVMESSLARDSVVLVTTVKFSSESACSSL